MQRLSYLADGQERVGARFFNFQRLFVVSLNKTDKPVEYRQSYLCRLVFGCLQGFHYFRGFC